MVVKSTLTQRILAWGWGGLERHKLNNQCTHWHIHWTEWLGGLEKHKSSNFGSLMHNLSNSSLLNMRPTYGGHVMLWVCFLPSQGPGPAKGQQWSPPTFHCKRQRNMWVRLRTSVLKGKQSQWRVLAGSFFGARSKGVRIDSSAMKLQHRDKAWLVLLWIGALRIRCQDCPNMKQWNWYKLLRVRLLWTGERNCSIIAAHIWVTIMLSSSGGMNVVEVFPRLAMRLQRIKRR